MIVHYFNPKSGLIALTPEDVDDLWFLRRFIKVDDLISSETSRVVKNDNQYARPNKGERIKVSIVLKVKDLKLNGELERLRISGIIIEASNEAIPKGAHHTLTITQGQRFSLKKEEFNINEIQLLQTLHNKDTRFIVVAMDRREAGIGVVRGTHLQIYATIKSGCGGKRYGEVIDINEFYNRVEEVIKSIYNEGQKVFIVGPGMIKKAFANHIKDSELKKVVKVIEGIDLAGEDGIYIALHSPNLRKAIENTKIARIMNLLDEVMRRIKIGDNRVSFTFNDTYNASKIGAIEALIVSSKILKTGVNEEDLMKMLDMVESYNGKSYLVDNSTDIGIQVSKLGGAVALLRFPIG